MDTQTAPLPGIPRPQQQQSFAPQVAIQTPPPAYANDPTLLNAWRLNNQAQGYLPQEQQLVQDQSTNQSEVNKQIANFARIVPSGDDLVKAHANNLAASKKVVEAQAAYNKIANQKPNAGKIAAVMLGSMLGPAGMLGGVALAGGFKHGREISQALQDLQSAQYLDKNADATDKELQKINEDYISRLKTKGETQNQFGIAASRFIGDLQGLSSQTIGLAKAPGEMALTKARTTEAQSNADINAYLQSKGIAPLKFQHQQLVNQGEELGIENKKLENKKLNQDLSNPPKQELTPAQHIQIHQLDGKLNDARAEYKTAQGRYNGMLSVIAKAKAPKTQQEIDDLAANKAQLAAFKEQMDHASDSIKTYEHMQNAIVTPVQGHGPMTKPPAVGNPHVTVDEEGNPVTLYQPPAPAKTNNISLKAKYYKIFSDPSKSKEERDKAHKEYLFLMGK